MFLHVTKAKYLRDFQIEVNFNDGRQGTVDLTDTLQGPMFEPLKDVSLFAQLSLDGELETIVWPNGADLAPEYLYFRAFEQEPELQASFKEWGYIG